MAVERQIRISDDDRDRYNDVIKSAYADGRITDSELGDRLEAVLEARFESELVPVVADLPNPPPLAPMPSSTSSAEEVSSAPRARSVGPEVTPFLMAPIICTTVYAMTDFGGYFWPIWVWFGCSIPVVGAFIARRLSR